MSILALAKELALAAGRGAVDRIVELVRGKPDETPTAATGLTHRDFEHQQAQIRSATAHRPRPKT